MSMNVSRAETSNITRLPIFTPETEQQASNGVALMTINSALLISNQAYQRDPDQKKVAEIVDNFDPHQSETKEPVETFHKDIPNGKKVTHVTVHLMNHPSKKALGNLAQSIIDIETVLNL